MNQSERLLAEARKAEEDGLASEDQVERVRLTSYARHLRRIALQTWRGEAPEPQEEGPYEFSPGELARLETYRAAVQAGFYNEG